MPLDIQVDTLQTVDEPARRFLLCLLHRGATLVGTTGVHWETDISRPLPSIAPRETG